ncbi:MAG: hypothetical protein GF368_02280 [Candidatus Aenigmarchaeota archaeon]|nr:hypothetical protein [Candidatus Aenigmarchaeota archaeon]
MKRNILVAVILVFSLISVNADFKVWVERGGVFTIGEPATFLIYVENSDSTLDSYEILEPDVYYTYPPGPGGTDLSNLIDVSLQSNRIEDVGPDGVKDTQGTIMLLAQIYSEGTVTFTVESDNTGNQEQAVIQISGGASGGVPRTLPEFNFIGLLQILGFGFLIFYSFWVKKSTS